MAYLPPPDASAVLIGPPLPRRVSPPSPHAPVGRVHPGARRPRPRFLRKGEAPWEAGEPPQDEPPAPRSLLARRSDGSTVGPPWTHRMVLPALREEGTVPPDPVEDSTAVAPLERRRSPEGAGGLESFPGRGSPGAANQAPGPLWPSRSLLRDWMIACAGGEFFGLAVAGTVAVVLHGAVGEPSSTVDRLVLLVGCTLGGALEGAILGGAQGRVLFRRLPALALQRFTLLTALVAAGAWAFAMGAVLWAAPAAGAAEPPLGLLLLGTAALGGVAGAIFGAVQALPLARAGVGARRWIGGSALGWAFGLPAAWLSISLGADLGGGLWSMVFAGAGGLLAGLFLAVATARLSLPWLQPRWGNRGAGVPWHRRVDPPQPPHPRAMVPRI